MCASLQDTLSVQLGTHLDAILLHLEDARDRLTESQRQGDTDFRREALLTLELLQNLSVQLAEQIARRVGSGPVKSEGGTPYAEFRPPNSQTTLGLIIRSSRTHSIWYKIMTEKLAVTKNLSSISTQHLTLGYT
jgi:hypothetical protein